MLIPFIKDHTKKKKENEEERQRKGREFNLVKEERQIREHNLVGVTIL